MEIERSELIQSLEQFALAGNGIVIGRPGVGKSHSLLKLKKLFKEKEIPHLFLPIDQLGGGTDEELRNHLFFEEDLISKLHEEINQLQTPPGIILFDAFDAARNEEIRDRYVILINRIISELKGLWNVIVTVRTYDALKSEKLLKLFGESSPNDNTQYQNKDVKCRHFVIPPLNEDEVKQAVGQIPGLDTIYENASTDLKDLLKIPFNLWLIERILKDSRPSPDISRVTSEVQLLGLFWENRVRNRIDGDERESILTRLARKLITEHSLSTRKENVFITAEKEIWAKLLSDEILMEISSSKQRVSFSHNILFDYAVSTLIIDDDFREFKIFILEDPSRPVFLRPSLDYYFTRLWNDDPTIFWIIYRDILLDNYPDLNAFTRLIPPLVIAREAREIQQFKPLTGLFDKNNKAANKGMLHILQAHKCLQVTRDLLWIQILEMISRYIHTEFAWEMTQLASNIFDRARKAGDDSIMEICGRVGRVILDWIWQKRKENPAWFDRLGASWAAVLVAKSFKTDIKESGRLLKKIFTISGEQEFPVEYFLDISEYIDKILPHDPDFVAQIYKTVYGYEELSQERTTLGSPILNFSISKRDNFQLCQYVLKEKFPTFLKINPQEAMKTAILFLNKHIIREHVNGHLKEGVELENLVERFCFRGKEAHFFPDNSAIWDNFNSWIDRPIEIAGIIFSFLKELAESGKNHNLLESLLDVFRDNVIMAFFWKRLLKLGVKCPKAFAPLLFEICIARPIQVKNETIHQLGEFLEKASENFSKEQLMLIEKSILEIPGRETDTESRESLVAQRNRLLACIPEMMLITDEAKGIIKALRESGQTPKNEPLYRWSISTGIDAAEMFERNLGIKIECEENQQLMKYFEPLENFEARWRKELPDEEAIQKIFKIVGEAFQILQNGPMAEQKVINDLWTKLAAAAETMSKVNLAPDNKEFQFCREVLLKCSEHEQPTYREDSEEHFAGFPSWSPAPRIEAAQGLFNLVIIKPDEELLLAIERLLFDRVPAVRFNVAHRLYLLYSQSKEYFWRVIEKFARNEKNKTIQNALCTTLWNVARYDEEQTAKILELVLISSLDQDIHDISNDHRISLLVELFLALKNQWAKDTINNILEKKEAPSSVFKTLVFNISEYLGPVKITSREDQVKMAIETLEKILDIFIENIIEYTAIPGDELSEKQKKKIADSYEILEEILTQIYFHSDKREVSQETWASDAEFKSYYDKVKPLLQKIVSSLNADGGGLFLAAHTTHYFMKLFDNVLKFDPKGVLNMAAKIASASKPSGYNLDSIAAKDVVKIVETILADHRNAVKEASSLQDLVSLLDIFAEAGWPEAIQLTWRLDEVFR